MKEILLSHDSEVYMYSVPDKVADNLEKYCLEFTDWIWNNPNGSKLLIDIGDGEMGAMYGAEDFIDYLNEWIFPNQKSELIKEMDFYYYEIPTEYKKYPCFNF